MRPWSNEIQGLFSPAGSIRQLASYGSDGFHWTAPKIVLSIFLFFVAGLAEIGGGWFVWQAVRGIAHVDGKHWWQDRRSILYAVLGGLSLVGYGFLPTAQPPPNFGRLYAVYGGFFIVLSFAWGWIVDKDKPDKGTLSSILLLLVPALFELLIEHQNLQEIALGECLPLEEWH